MSRVYFHSPSGEAELRGSERAHADITCRDLALSALDREIDPFSGESPLLAWLAPGHYTRLVTKEAFAKTFQTWFSGSFGDELTDPGTGTGYSPFTLSLNTAIVAGSDPIRLFARIHGQCELHGYVEGPDRAWLALIMETGLRDNIFRPDQGWESVIEFLRTRDNEPVVMSYSVTEAFPNPYIVVDAGLAEAPEDEEENDAWYESWYDTKEEQQWSLALTALRKLNETSFLQLHPDTFTEQRFGGGESAFDIVRLIHDSTRSKT